MRFLTMAFWVCAWTAISSEAWATTLDIPFTTRVPAIDGRLDWAEWNQSARMNLANGFIAIAHDGVRLYVLIDVLGDDGDDPYADDGQDQFWLLFDVDEDGSPTEDVDLRYRLSSAGNLRYQTYCEDCADDFNPLEATTYSSRGEGFGCFVADLSVLLFPLRCSVHRVWEVAIDLAEIGATGDNSAKLGYRITSGTPELLEREPADHLDAANYIDLNLALVPRLPRAIDLGPLETVQFEVTQAIQTPLNELDLAAEKPTAVRIWDTQSNDATFKNYIYGAKQGVDLPGSPLLDVGVISPNFRGNPRHSVDLSSFTVLPKSWTEAGTVDFGITVQAIDNSIAATLGAEVNFLPTRKPVFWTIPVRNNIGGSTTTRPEASLMAQNEQTMLSLAPLTSIDIVRRPLFDTKVSSSEELKEALREYDLQTRLAWTLMLFLTGEPAYDLPDQITGFVGRTLGSGGSSDPTWIDNGAARISWVLPSAGAYTFAHEVNHNLDTDNTGSWGRHSRGCNVAGPDPAWPYFASFAIQEVGVEWQGSGFISVNEETPDIMSYCIADVEPFAWMSPYRWTAWLNLFRDDATVNLARLDDVQVNDQAVGALDLNLVDPEDSFYIMGRVYPDGTGELGQIIRHPGISTGDDAVGDYVLRVLNCDEQNIDAAGFSASFVDVEGEPVPFVSFEHVLSASPEACSIVLEQNGTEIYSRAVSDNPPWVELQTPNGDENWDGVEAVAWQAGDDDGDPLLFTLLYSPDNGDSWHSVATGISGDHYDVNSTQLPGGSEAIIRVLASDGANTGYDESDAPFTVVEKMPAAFIVSPGDGTIHDVNEALTLDGYAQDVFGQRLAFSELVWMADGAPVATGSPAAINLDPGEHLIELLVLEDDDVVAQESVTVTMTELGGAGDPIDTDPDGIDVIAAKGFVSGEDFVCELVVNSGDSGLINKSDFTCHIDFHEFEDERESGCDADGARPLKGAYRLGSNGACSTSDMGLNYRIGKNGGECTGGPGIFCLTNEFNAEGDLDSQCDGTVDGDPATSCRIQIVLPLSVIRSERERQCGECLGEVDGATGEYSAFGFYDAHVRSSEDHIPDTNDNRVPNSLDEVFYLLLR